MLDISQQRRLKKRDGVGSLGCAPFDVIPAETITAGTISERRTLVLVRFFLGG
jgi:hypothetical protein